MYHCSRNTMHFSFFTIEFFPPTQKIIISKKVSASLTEEQKQNSFLLLRLKTISIDPYLILLKQLCCCCLDIRFFLLILIGVSFCNLLQLYFSFMFFFFLCIDMLRIALQLLNVVLNLCVIKNYIVASYLI